MKYIIPKNKTIGSSFECIFGDEEATKKTICAAMEYIEENKHRMPSYVKFAGNILISDDDKENTIDIQRNALKRAGYTDWGGLLGNGPLDGPSREIYALSLAKIQVYGWDKWIASLITKEERKIKEDKELEKAIIELKEELSKETDLNNIKQIISECRIENEKE